MKKKASTGAAGGRIDSDQNAKKEILGYIPLGASGG
jgi:hypothetical protein